MIGDLIMTPTDYAIVKRGDYYILVARDKFTIGVYTCDAHGIIIPPGNRLLLTHLTYEQNFVTFRHVLGRMYLEKERYIIGNETSFQGEYFGVTRLTRCHKMEVIDSIKIYNNENGIEYIYAIDDLYESIDGSHIEHMKTARANFENYINSLQEKLKPCSSIIPFIKKIKFICTKCGRPGEVRSENDLLMRKEWNIPYPEFQLCWHCKEKIKYKEFICIHCNEKFILTGKQAYRRLDRDYTLDICPRCSRSKAAKKRLLDMDPEVMKGRLKKIADGTQRYWDNLTIQEMEEIRNKKKDWFDNLSPEERQKVVAGIKSRNKPRR